MKDGYIVAVLSAACCYKGMAAIGFLLFEADLHRVLSLLEYLDGLKSARWLALSFGLS